MEVKSRAFLYDALKTPAQNGNELAAWFTANILTVSVVAIVPYGQSVVILYSGDAVDP